MSDPMNADLLAGQLAGLYETYKHESRMTAGYGHAGPLAFDALPVPVALLEAAVAVKENRASKELDAVRLLLRMLWQMYDAGGISSGRSVQARIVEATMMLVGPPTSGFASVGDAQVMHVLKQCEDHAYELTCVARSGDEWEAASARFRAACEQRDKVKAAQAGASPTAS
jgi:hypothetical protein